MGFQIGDRVVVPNYGVGKIRCVDAMRIEGRDYDVFVIDILANGMEYRVSVDQVGANAFVAKYSANELAEKVLARVQAFQREKAAA